MGGRFCETRREGNDQRVACDYVAVGQAADTGRWGHPTEQFLAIAKAPGKYEGCASPNAPVHPQGGLCGGYEVK